nr:hypothetical protein [Pseudoroseomonas vastitatis]
MNIPLKSKRPGHLSAPGRIAGQPDLTGTALLALQNNRLAAALAITHFQAQLLALLNVLLAGALQHGGVQEHVLPAIIGGHEAEAAHLIEPLDGATDRIGRATFVAAAELAARRTIAKRPRSSEAATGTGATEITARRTITEAATTATEAATTEIATRRTIAEAAATAGTEAAAVTEIPTRGTVAEVAARRTITEAATAELAARTVTTGGRSRAELALMNPGHEAAALPVRADLANQLVAGLGRLDPGFSQGRGVKEHILAIRAEHETETLAAVVPLDLGLDRLIAALRITIRKHCVSNL